MVNGQMACTFIPEREKQGCRLAGVWAVALGFFLSGFLWGFCFPRIDAVEGQRGNWTLAHRFYAGSVHRYKLIVNGEASRQMGEQTQSVQMTATLDVERRVKKVQENGAAILDIIVSGGIMRIFTQWGQQIQRMPKTSVTLTMTPRGELLKVQGLAPKDIDEMALGFDLIALALGAITVALPKTPVQVGDSWQAEHSVGVPTTPLISNVQFLALENFQGRPVAKLQARYHLPIDQMVDPTARRELNLSAFHRGESEVLFSPEAGVAFKANGQVHIETRMSIPVPSSGSSKTLDEGSEQETDQNRSDNKEEKEEKEKKEKAEGSEQSPPPEEERTTSNPSTPRNSTSAANLRIEARYELTLAPVQK